MSIILFILIFCALVVSHEFGHFIVGIKCGIKVREFTIGMGPAIFKKEYQGVLFALRLFPIGGACIFEGEDGMAAEQGDVDEHLFTNVPVWSRIATLFAGPFFNFLLAYLCALVVVSFSGTDLPQINSIMEGSAAQEAGLQPGDLITKIDGTRVHIYREVSLSSLLNTDGEPMKVEYERDGERYQVVLTPKYSEDDERYYMGFTGGRYIRCNPGQIFAYSYFEVQYLVRYTFKSIEMLLTGKVGADSLAGPVGMAQFVGETYEEVKPYGIPSVILTMLSLVILLSVNLGVMNLLPLPALDGGRLIFQFVELVRGKPVPPEKEGIVHLIGLAGFLILMVFVMYNDIMRLIH